MFLGLLLATASYAETGEDREGSDKERSANTDTNDQTLRRSLGTLRQRSPISINGTSLVTQTRSSERRGART
jgi:hypothetical protein